MTNNNGPYWSIYPHYPEVFGPPFGTTCIYCGHDANELICGPCMDALEFKPAPKSKCCANPHPHVPGGIHCQRD